MLWLQSATWPAVTCELLQLSGIGQDADVRVRRPVGAPLVHGVSLETDAQLRLVRLFDLVTAIISILRLVPSSAITSKMFECPPPGHCNHKHMVRSGQQRRRACVPVHVDVLLFDCSACTYWSGLSVARPHKMHASPFRRLAGMLPPLRIEFQSLG